MRFIAAPRNFGGWTRPDAVRVTRGRLVFLIDLGEQDVEAARFQVVLDLLVPKVGMMLIEPGHEIGEIPGR